MRRRWLALLLCVASYPTARAGSPLDQRAFAPLRRGLLSDLCRTRLSFRVRRPKASTGSYDRDARLFLSGYLLVSGPKVCREF